MAETLASTLIALIVALLIVLIFRNKQSSFLKVIGLVVAYHLVYVILVFLPIEYPSLSIQAASMNWSGKVMAFVFSIVFYFLLKNKLVNNDFIFSTPSRGSLRKVILAGVITIAAMCLLTFLFSNGKPMDVEKLLYQLIIPGLDEELWRGILLGFLILIVKDLKYKFGHPVVWVTTIIFSLGHSLYFQDWQLGFAADAFIVTGALGYILGWMTLRTRSVLPALIFHNLINFSTTILEMTM